MRVAIRLARKAWSTLTFYHCFDVIRPSASRLRRHILIGVLIKLEINPYKLSNLKTSYVIRFHDRGWITLQIITLWTASLKSFDTECFRGALARISISKRTALKLICPRALTKSCHVATHAEKCMRTIASHKLGSKTQPCSWSWLHFSTALQTESMCRRRVNFPGDLGHLMWTWNGRSPQSTAPPHDHSKRESSSLGAVFLLSESARSTAKFSGYHAHTFNVHITSRIPHGSSPHVHFANQLPVCLLI